MLAGIYTIAWKLLNTGAAALPVLGWIIGVYPEVWDEDVWKYITQLLSCIFASQSNQYLPAVDIKPTWSSIREKNVQLLKS